MKISKVDPALIAGIQKTEVGLAFDLPWSLFPMFPKEKVQAFCTEQDAKFTQFALYWAGIRIADVVAEFNGVDLIMEVL